MLGNKGDRHDHKVRNATIAHPLDRVLRVRLQPRHGAYTALEGQMEPNEVRVETHELCVPFLSQRLRHLPRYQQHALLDMLLVRIA